MKIIGKTQSQIEAENNRLNLQKEEQELIAYMDETDWYYARLYETQKAVPQEVVDKRKFARSRISEIRNILNGEFI